MKRPRISVACALILLASFVTGSQAEVALHGLFSENAVLQQQMNVPIWGTARDGEKVTVAFQTQSVSTVASNGQWRVTLRPLHPGGPFRLEVKGDNSITRTNILVGEVWISAGQSNMQFPVMGCDNPDAIIANSTDPMLRLFTPPSLMTDEPQRDVKGDHWLECVPATAREFAAVGYFFARDLRKARPKIPVGMIDPSIGGTSIWSWMPREYLERDPKLAPILERFAKFEREHAQAMEQFKRDEPELMKKHAEAVEKAKAEGKTPPPPPKPPIFKTQHRPYRLYNGMIAPLQPYAFRGALWYQGESNAGHAYDYRTLLPTLIRSWREKFGHEHSFLIVELPPFGNATSPDGNSPWSELREAQMLTWRNVPKTAVVVTTDVGDCVDLHPKKKEPIGQRLALAARAVAYGERIEYSGPVYHAMQVQGDRVTLTFTHVGGGLVANGGELKGFTIAAEGGKFVPAKADIKGDTIRVWSADVPKPVAVRYGWVDCPDVNLFNKAGLPASPFRTDDYPISTAPK